MRKDAEGCGWLELLESVRSGNQTWRHVAFGRKWRLHRCWSLPRHFRLVCWRKCRTFSCLRWWSAGCSRQFCGDGLPTFGQGPKAGRFPACTSAGSQLLLINWRVIDTNPQMKQSIPPHGWRRRCYHNLLNFDRKNRKNMFLTQNFFRWIVHVVDEGRFDFHPLGWAVCCSAGIRSGISEKLPEFREFPDVERSGNGWIP